MEQQNGNQTTPAEEHLAQPLPGAALREARERLNLSIADAAAQTKLAPRQIEALEADDYQKLPEIAFVRGFVRSYAKILGLDAQPLLAALPQPGRNEEVAVPVEAPLPDARSQHTQNLIWLGAALFLSVVVVAVAVWNITAPPSAEEAKVAGIETLPVETAVSLPAAVEVLAASAIGESAVIAASQVAAASAVLPLSSVAAVAQTPSGASAPVAATLATLRLSFGQGSWTEVRDGSGKLLSSQHNQAGSELVLQGQGPFVLVIGHANAVRLTYKGKAIDLAPYTNGASEVARLRLE